ncbi:hypothetical protein F3Y22_tig00111640pilonHSYRG00184 [Hibiscus syriacus]|uniref:HMA domain-containing protein n=1 Tax=Hibiscus syriacus TaxID=106335 RepID=A0A6A2Y4U9_HIBSY|nr:uncharacterized protein LOC120166546 [Hibiscus syriacus]KAE8675955.1 hypothetical protein F3Y22_tig00111640pilonHSYRG00184 [Hibiscus syriacus]
MEQSKATCTLKVNINCCNDCRTKAREKLQKISGVEAVDNDSKGVLTISGKVNPMVIVKKIEKWGRKAELLSLEQSPNRATDNGDPHHELKCHTNDDCCCHCDSISDSESEIQNGPEAAVSNKTNNPSITSNDQTTKSKAMKWCFGLFRKKNEAKVTMVEAPPSKGDGPSRWQFPRTPMLDYGGGPRPYYQPFRPYHPPPMMGRHPGPSRYPFGVMRPLPMPPYGVFNSRPPPMVNPMIHYTSYADNYSPW